MHLSDVNQKLNENQNTDEEEYEGFSGLEHKIQTICSQLRSLEMSKQEWKSLDELSLLTGTAGCENKTLKPYQV